MAWAFSVLLLALSAAANNQELEKSVVYGGAYQNDVNAVSSDQFLKNFRSLHNETDLEAQPAEEKSVAVDAPAADNRADSAGTRVLRGTLADFTSLAFYSPLKHNTIDTADFSDCALQGEWKPIGVPEEHYTHHAEDHQKEHFHTLNPDDQHPHQSIPVINTHHSPIEAEGLAFWNQLVKEPNHNLHFMHHGPPKRPQHRPHPKPKPHHKPYYHRRPAPTPAAVVNPVQHLDIFEGLRNPHGDENLLHIQEKPVLADDGLLQQTLFVPQPPQNAIDLALLQGVDPALNVFPPFVPEDIQSSPLNAPQALANTHIKYEEDNSFLSPPPLPPRFPSKPVEIRQKPEYRPKFTYKPKRPKYNSGPRRPSPVNEYPEEHRHHIAPPSHHDDSKSHLHALPHSHESIFDQNPKESSTFTCGHNHAEGTNYHTASYQVEGESDPSLLEDDITGSSHLLAPIIVGHPVFQQEGPVAPLNNHAFSHAEAPLDLAEEGTETGDGGDEDVSKETRSPFAEKLQLPKTSTESSTLETTAPQTFRPQAQALTQNSGEDSKTSATSFVHSGFTNVGVHHNHKPSDSHEQGTFKKQHKSGHQSSDSPTFASHGPFNTFGHGSSSATSFSQFSSSGNSRPLHKEHVPVYHHTPSPRNHTKKEQGKKRPYKPYQVSEDSGERIPLSAIFPPKKMPKQFDMRMPNFANPNFIRPSFPKPTHNKLKSSIHFDGSNVGVYTSHPRNKVTKIRLKMKNKPTSGPRFPESDFRKAISISSRGH